MTLLLASWLATQAWSWAPVPTATAYRIYWGASGIAWCAANRVEIPATACTATLCEGEIPMPDFTPAFIMVTAVNSYGESVTEHGNVVVCP